MEQHKHEPAKVTNFSLAFERLCSMVAIDQTRGADETLGQLLLQCLVFLPEDKFFNEKEFADALDGLFGLNIPEHEIKFVIEKLLTLEVMQRTNSEQFVLPKKIFDELQTRINEAYSLEERVRREWQKEISEKYSNVPFDQAWKALRNYLAKAFQRHGMQTIALLDPLVDIAPEYTLSLSELLRDAVTEFSPDMQNDFKNLVSGFLVRVPVKSHTLTGACRTVGTRKILA